MSDIKDLINAVIEKNPVDFSETFDQIMRLKASEAIDAKRIEVAENFNESDDLLEDDKNEDDEDFDLDDEDLDLSDEDLEGIDFDDLDLDLDTEE